MVVFPGGGYYFFWQAGVAARLRERGELKDKILLGASAGALAAVFTACQVDLGEAARCAERLLEEHGVYSRVGGFVGIWGRIVEAWLATCLPEDAAERCNRQGVHIIITQAPWTRRIVTEFRDREHLIQALLASTHVPWVMDGRMCRVFEGQWCTDGGLFGVPVPGASGGVIDYRQDPELRAGWWEWMRVGVRGRSESLVRRGYLYAEAQWDAKGDK